MTRRQIYDREHHAQFVTFSCYHRRRALDNELLRDALIELLAEKLTSYGGICSGYVIMPEHVHPIVWFGNTGAIDWKWSSARHYLLNELPEVPLEWIS